MSKRILVATDLSDAGTQALRQAASYPDAALAVVHVMPNLVDMRPLFPQETEANVAHAVDIEARVVDAVTDAAKAVTKGKFEVFVEQGLAHEHIVARAEQWRAELVVVGTHGRTGLSSFLLGSVAERVVRSAPCSVLVARKQRTGPVVAATDLSEASLPAVTVGAREAARRGSKLIVLHIVDHALSDFATSALSQFLGVVPPSNADLLREVQDAKTKQVEAFMKGAKVEGEVRVIDGSAASGIVRTATELSADLVVVGAHGRSGVRDFVLGTVSSRVIAGADCSVLTVR